MRIARLTLHKFGGARLRRFDFGAPGKLALLFAPNEAGKSTARRALEAFLFGIDEGNRRDAAGASLNDLRVDAVLADEAGKHHGPWRRRKSRGGAGGRVTLTAATDGATADCEPQLLELLGGLDRDEFRRRCCFDHADLRAGSAALLDQSGGLDAALLNAGGGVDLKALRTELVTAAAEIFPPSGRGKQANEHLQKVRDLRAAAKQASTSPADWEAHTKDKLRAEKDLEQIAQDERAHGLRRRDADRRMHARELAVSWQKCRDALAPMEQTAVLPPHYAVADRKLAQNALAELQPQLDKLQWRALELQANAQWRLEMPQPVAEALANRHAEIAEAKAKARSMRDKQESRGRQTTDRNALLQRARELAADMGWTTFDPDVPPLPLPTDVERVLARELAEKYRLVHEAPERLARESATASDAVTRLQEELAELPVPGDVGALKLAEVHARQSAEDEAAAAKARNLAAVALEKALASAAKVTGLVVPLPTNPAEAMARIEAWPWPPTASADALREQIGFAQRQCEKTSSDRLDRASRLTEATARLKDKQGARPLPSADKLNELRQAREEVWQSIRQRWLDGPSWSPPADVADALARSHAAEDLQRRTWQADELADLLQAEGVRVGELAALRAAVASADEDLLAADHACTKADQHLRALEADWKTLLAAAGWHCEAVDWVEMRRRADAAAERADQWRNANTDSEAAAARARQSRATALASCHAAGYVLSDAAATTAAELLAKLGHKVEALQAQRGAWQAAADKLDSAKATQQKKAEELRGAQHDMDGFAAKWALALQPLGLPASATPAAVSRRIATLEELFGKLGSAENLAKTIRSIDDHLEGYNQEVAALAAIVAPDLLPLALEPAAKAEELARRCADAKTALETIGAAQRELQLNASQQAEVAEKIGQRRDEIARFCEMAAAATPDDLPRLEDESAAKRDALHQLEVVELALAQAAGSAEWRTFADEILATDGALAIQELDDLETASKDLHQRRDDAVQRKRDADRWLQAVRGDRTSADKLAEAASKVAEISELAGEFARLNLAIALLDGETQRFREQNQNPVLPRANAYFARLTCGAYKGVEESLDETGRPALFARTATDDEVPLAQLSDGATDQYYFALRLAFADRQAEVDAAPPPLFLDDVFVHFDENRTAAALGILAELAAKRQVVVFTHAEHLLTVARRQDAAGQDRVWDVQAV